eukprot:g15463.t1
MKSLPSSSSVNKIAGAEERLLKLIRSHPACVLALRLDVTMRISDEEIMSALAKSADSLDIEFRERMVPEDMIEEILDLRARARAEEAKMLGTPRSWRKTRVRRSQIRRHNVWIVLMRLPLCASVVLVFTSFVMWLTSFEYIRGLCALYEFANATCNQENTCLFRVAVQVPGEVFAIFHPAWKPPAEDGMDIGSLFSETGPFKCCNTPAFWSYGLSRPTVGAGSPCCDFFDDPWSLFCDNFGDSDRQPKTLPECPASPWACGVKTEIVDRELQVKPARPTVEIRPEERTPRVVGTTSTAVEAEASPSAPAPAPEAAPTVTVKAVQELLFELHPDRLSATFHVATTLQEMMRPIITPAPKALPRNPAGGERAGAGAAPHGAATSRSQGAARAPRAGAGRSPKAASSRKMVAQVMQMSQTQEQWMKTSAQLRQLGAMEELPPELPHPAARSPGHGHDLPCAPVEPLEPMESKVEEADQTPPEAEEDHVVGEEEVGDEEAPVHGLSSRHISGHQEDGMVRQFLDKPGIPMPPIPRFRLTLCLRWLLLVAVLLGCLRALGQTMTEQTFYDIQTVRQLKLEVDNCDVEMAPLPPSLTHSAITIQYWKFMRQIHHVAQDNAQMTVQVDMRVKVPMFRCLISIFTNSSGLEKISGHVMFEAIAQEVELTSQQVTVQMMAMPKKLTLQSSQGLLAVRPSDVPDNWEATIQGTRANILLEIPRDAEKNSVFSGEKVVKGATYQMQAANSSKKLGAQMVCSLEAQFLGNLELDLEAEAAGYVKAGASAAEVVSGSSHDRPSFFNHSVELLDDLTQWIHARSEGVAPWVARSGEAERSFSLDGAVLASMGDLGRHHGPGSTSTDPTCRKAVGKSSPPRPS